MASDIPAWNPKMDRDSNSTKKALAFRLGDVGDPIGLEIKDPKKIRDLYRKWPLIPYAGTHHVSNDGLLIFYNAAKFMSPTQGACHGSIKSFLFGGKLNIVRSTDPDFEIGEEMEPILPAEKKAYSSFIKEIKNNKGSVKKVACDMYDEMASNGNIFIELVHSVTAGVRSTAYYHHPTEHCRYWATLKDEPMAVMVSELFTEDYFKRHPPQIIPVYPNYAVDSDGTHRTIIHIKNGNFKYYGRPAYSGAWIDIYGEGKERDYLSKIAANNFTGQGIMEVEDDDVETDGVNLDNEDAIDNGYSGINERFDANFTADSDDPQTWLFMSRPKGATPVFVYEFKINTNEGFYKTVGAMRRGSIIENNAWSERLLGNAVSEGFSQDNFIQELRIKDVSTLSAFRGFIKEALDLVFTEAALWAGEQEFAMLGVEISSALESLSKLKHIPLKDLVTAYGTLVRAGAITSTMDDEISMRSLLGIIGIPQAAIDAWVEDGGTRRPITLKAAEDSETEKNERGETASGGA